MSSEFVERTDWQTATFCILREGELVDAAQLKARQLAYIARVWPGQAHRADLRRHWSDSLRKTSTGQRKDESVGYVKRDDKGHYFLNVRHGVVAAGAARTKFDEYNSGQPAGALPTERFGVS